MYYILANFLLCILKTLICSLACFKEQKDFFGWISVIFQRPYEQRPTRWCSKVLKRELRNDSVRAVNGHLQSPYSTVERLGSPVAQSRSTRSLRWWISKQTFKFLGNADTFRPERTRKCKLVDAWTVHILIFFQLCSSSLLRFVCLRRKKLGKP